MPYDFFGFETMQVEDGGTPMAVGVADTSLLNVAYKSAALDFLAEEMQTTDGNGGGMVAVQIDDFWDGKGNWIPGYMDKQGNVFRAHDGSWVSLPIWEDEYLGPVPPGHYPPGSGGGTTGPGGGTGGGTPSIEIQNQASLFALQRMNSQIDVTNPAHVKWLEITRTFLTAWYIANATNPNGVIDGPGSDDFTITQYFSQFIANSTYNLVTTQLNNNFAASELTGQISVNVTHSAWQSPTYLSWGEMTIFYTVLHEQGHIPPGSDAQAYANTMGMAIALAIGLPYPTTGDFNANPWTQGLLPR